MFTGRTLSARILGWAAGLVLPVLLFPAEPNLWPYLRFNDAMPLFNGRPVTAVASVKKDAAGFLWIGTNLGLFRYDGYGFARLVAPMEGKGRVPVEDIFPVLPSRDGGIWVGTNGGGLLRWAPGARLWRRYPLPAEARLASAADIILALAEDREGRAWVGTRGAGLFRVEAASGRAEPFALPDGAGQDDVFALLADRQGRIWVGTHGRGVFLIDPSTAAVQRLSNGEGDEDGAIDNRVWALLESSSGAVYAGTRAGDLARYVEARKRFVRVSLLGEPAEALAGHPVTALAEDKQGRVWIGTADDGLRVVDPGSGRMDAFHHSRLDPDSLGDDGVTSLCVDAAGLLWVGTSGAGLFMTPHTAAAFTHFRATSATPSALPGDDIKAMLNSRTSGFWIGTEKGLFQRSAGSANLDLSFSMRLDLQVKALTEDADGFIWAAVVDAGVVRLDPRSGQVRRWRRTGADGGLLDDRVSSLWTGPNDPGGVWAGSPLGLDRIDRATGRVEALTVSSAAGGGNPHVQTLIGGREGRLWLGTRWRGLMALHLADRSLSEYRPSGDDGNKFLQVQALFEDRDGFVWVGRAGGLSRFDPATGRWAHFGPSEGFPSLDIRAILQDGEGGIWASTDRGIVRLNPATGLWREFVLADGIQAGEFNQGAAAADADGLLAWGGTQGLNVVDPGRVAQPGRPTRVILAGCSIVGRTDLPVFPPPGGMSLRLKAGETAVLDFALPDFTDPERNQFRFLLQGRDPNWTAAATRRQIELSGLRPGRYVLRVQAVGHGGAWDRDGLVMDIRVTRPLLRSPWLWLFLILILLTAALALVSRLRRPAPAGEPSVLATDDSAALARMAEAFRISNRESEILASILAGRSNDQIAEALFISPSTVRNHISNIYQKLGIRNRIQLLNLIKQHAAPAARTDDSSSLPPNR